MSFSDEFSYLKIQMKDIVSATNNFDRTKKIGSGGFGRVYRGELSSPEGRITVAFKQLDPRLGQGKVEFWKEIMMLSKYKHENVISLKHYCNEGDEMILVYEYASRGSLDRYLGDANTLSWIRRLNICVGAARGLLFLHDPKETQHRVLHRDVKSANILLDENWTAKISDFGLSKVGLANQGNTYMVSNGVGTPGYCDPLYMEFGFLSKESDVYSFGVVLFEVLCGKLCYEYRNHELTKILVPEWRRRYNERRLDDIILPGLREQMDPRSLETFSAIAYQCVKKAREERPVMAKVVEELEYAALKQRRWKFQHLTIRLSDIKSATNNFSEAYIISPRDCEYTLYRAELEHFDKENHSSLQGENGGQHPKRRSTVVIKRYPKEHTLYGEEQFFTEIEMLTSVDHPNIVTLLGFCAEGSEMIVVTPNVSKGYLYDYLGNDTPCTLTWERRLNICIDAAHALNYLHSEMEDQKMIIHRDINSLSIGLGENWRPKIVDFWSSVFLPPNQEDEALCLDWDGKPSYIDPEYKRTHKLKRESDVYSFGVVLFEVLSGRLAYDPIYKKHNANGLAVVAIRSFRTGTLQDIIDPMLKDKTGKPNTDSLDTFIEIAYQCVAETQDHRPTMKVVVNELEKALSFQENNKYNFRIPLEDIKLATQNFHDDNCIGGEGFWKVYKGNLQDGDGVNTIVAKRLDTRIGQGGKQFFSELRILREYKHENVIGLVGYNDEEDEKIIVHEYASKGSLDRYLNDASLTWLKRLNICIDVASALDFIHGGVGNQAKVIHRDIKTASMLLKDDWKAKLADFGLSIISPIIQENDYVIDGVCGTKGYLDPLYYKSGFLTIESDIYSFGVVLFEILCGRSTLAIKKHEGHYLSDFIKNRFEEGKHDEVVFEQIKEQIMPKSLTIFQEIAYQSLHHEREKRPTTKKVLMQLTKALELQVSYSSVDDVPLNALINIEFNLFRVPLKW